MTYNMQVQTRGGFYKPPFFSQPQTHTDKNINLSNRPLTPETSLAFGMQHVACGQSLSEQLSFSTIKTIIFTARFARVAEAAEKTKARAGFTFKDSEKAETAEVLSEFLLTNSLKRDKIKQPIKPIKPIKPMKPMKR